ncbi:MAG: rod shape-determining protein MreC [Coriobacteriia bacterium]
MRISAETPKRGNPTLLIGLVVVSLILVTVYYRESDSGPLHRLRGGVLAVSAPLARLGDAIASPFEAAGDWVAGIGVRRDELDSLSEQNAELRARLAELEEARQENERLRELVEFAEERQLTKLGARVIGKPATPWEGALLIDRGSADGVEPGMPVLAAQGLVGQVYEVSERVAKVRLLTDQRSGVAAMVQSSRVPGVVQGSVEGALTLEFVAADAAPVVGDVVITSGLGGVYPKGLVIGDVTGVAERRGELFPRIDVASRIEIDRLEEVLILLGTVSQDEASGGDVE